MRTTTIRNVLEAGVLAVVLAAGCARPPAPGDPLPGLTAAERARFDRGKDRRAILQFLESL